MKIIISGTFLGKSSKKNPIIHKKGSILVNRTYEAEEKDQFGNIQIVRKTIPENIYQELYKYFRYFSWKNLCYIFGINITVLFPATNQYPFR